jgi:hypothetical protein
MGACASADGTVDQGAGEAASGDGLLTETATNELVAIESALLDLENDTAAIDGAALPKPLDTLLASWGVRPPARCVHTTPWIDRDRDGIPARWRAEFDCLIHRADGVRVRIDGAVVVADTDDQVAMSGMSMEFDWLHVALFQQRNLLLGQTIHGVAWVEAVPGTRPLAKLVLGHSVKLALERGTGLDRFTGVYTSDLEGTYVPDINVVGVTPFARGTLDFDEHATVTIGNDAPLALRLQTAPTLHYNVACKTRDGLTAPFDDGAYMIAFRRETVWVSFTGCGEWTSASLGSTKSVGSMAVQRPRDTTAALPALAQPRPKPTNTGDPPQLPPPLE